MFVFSFLLSFLSDVIAICDIFVTHLSRLSRFSSFFTRLDISLHFRDIRRRHADFRSFISDIFVMLIAWLMPPPLRQRRAYRRRHDAPVFADFASLFRRFALSPRRCCASAAVFPAPDSQARRCVYGITPRQRRRRFFIALQSCMPHAAFSFIAMVFRLFFEPLTDIYCYHCFRFDYPYSLSSIEAISALLSCARQVSSQQLYRF
jgi:hypothetical protein